ncbi:MAG: hypothetical protein AAFX96_09925 [Pseudomonadota bacterium]
MTAFCILHGLVTSSVVQEIIVEAILPLIIQAVSGMVGGGFLSSLSQQTAMHIIPKLLAGGAGGIAGGMTLGPVITAVASEDAGIALKTGSLFGQIGGAAIGGAALTVVAGILMKGWGAK